jgi:hypothetical protein
MSYLDQRPPPCFRCGTVDPAFGSQPPGFRHECNQVGLIAMRCGFDNAVDIGKSVVQFLTGRRP